MENKTVLMLLGVAALVVAIIFLKRRRTGNGVAVATTAAAPPPGTSQQDVLDAFTAPPDAASQLVGGTVYSYTPPPAPAAPGDQNNPLPYSSFKPGTMVDSATYYSSGSDTYVLMPSYNGQFNTPLLISKPAPTESPLDSVLNETRSTNVGCHWQPALTSFNGETNTPLYICP